MLQRVKGFRLPLTCRSTVCFSFQLFRGIIFKHNFNGCEFVSDPLHTALRLLPRFLLCLSATFLRHVVLWQLTKKTALNALSVCIQYIRRVEKENFNVPKETSKVPRTFLIRLILVLSLSYIDLFNRSAIHSIFSRFCVCIYNTHQTEALYVI